MGRAQRRRATAASARPPRTPRAYGFTAPRSFSSFLRPLFSIVAHCVRLYPMPQPWMASATVNAEIFGFLELTQARLEFLDRIIIWSMRSTVVGAERDLYACRDQWLVDKRSLLAIALLVSYRPLARRVSTPP